MKKRKKERMPTRSNSAEALEDIKDRWFRPEMMRLLRLEDDSHERIGVNLDLMPPWGRKHMLKILQTFTGGPGVLDLPRRELITSEHFGELLGMKSSWAEIYISLNNSYESLSDDASKSKFTKFVGGFEAIANIKSHLPDARRIQVIEQKAFLRVRKQNLIEKGSFFKGYGRGLLIWKRILDWASKGGDKAKRKAFVNAYVFLHWQEIEQAGKRGGWLEIFKDFRQSSPKSAEISDETLVKSLKRAGFSGAGKVGRPKKSGQNS